MTGERSSHSWFACAVCGWNVRAKTEPVEVPPTCRCGYDMTCQGPAPSPEEMPNVHVAPPLPAIPGFPRDTPQATVWRVPDCERADLTEEGRAISSRLLSSVFAE